MRPFPRLRVLRIAAGWMVVLAGLLMACSGSTEGLFGQELFQRNCAVCHGSGGEGSATRPALNEGSNAATLSDEQIRGVISVGPGAMPSFRQLSDTQIDSLVVFLRELQGSAAVGD